MVRLLTEADAEAYFELRRASLLDTPLAFASSPEDDVASSADAIREQLRSGSGPAIFGAFRPGLVGAVGLGRDRHVKAAHKAYLWGMYVMPAFRREGIGAELLQAALRHARSMEGVAWVHLSVSSTAPAARRLYERAGFATWGTEPEALRYAGQAADEHHMALRLT